ncbi:MAG: 2-succinyl-5-enolpyruvyl-6-hydroxy-3-cyclohexene-1-carboxylic-acid synthase [Balneolaceae bacterium]
MNNHLEWTSVLIRSLYKNGVRYAIISPGSRSTPLALAAAIHPGINKKIVLDERSAAFIALGIGKATGIPAILICTSGTALANYYPAIIEAKESGVPMIILSADRPPNLRGIGSSQTIDQLNIFGNNVAYFHDTGEPVSETDDLNRLNYLGKQAVQFSVQRGGAVHLNLPFRKPLEPTEEELNRQTNLSESQTTTISERNLVSTYRIKPNKHLVDIINNSRKPLIICGPSDPAHSLQSQIRELAETLNAPVISEPGSSVNPGNRDLFRFEQFLRQPDILTELKPDLILRFGDQPFTKSILDALPAWKNLDLIHITSRESTQDHTMSISDRLIVHKDDQIDYSDILPKSDKQWLEKWLSIEKNAAEHLLSCLMNTKSFTDGHIFSYLSKSLSNDWNVMLSNSFPVRDMALFGKSSGRQFVNRGAAGIDGIMSTAIGIHLTSNEPSCCIVGDLAFLHDSNALYSLKSTSSPFLIVVINNGGGTIFRMLPVYHSATSKIPRELYQAYFETPQQVSVNKLAEASGIDYLSISEQSQLSNLKPSSLSSHTIIECFTDADQSMELRKKLWGQ